MLLLHPVFATAQAPDTAAPRNDYIIGPGDSLQVFVLDNPELSVIVPVRPDGRISTPLVEDMMAVGKTPAQLARDVEQVLGEFVLSPTVNVILQNAAGTFSQVQVIGQVKTQQSVPYRKGLRVLDVVLLSGGLSDFAAPNRAKVVRNIGDGRTRDIGIRLGDLLNKGDAKQNIELQPGDLLVVPQARF
ncbi:MAG TPA: XrtA/PEP-CTERM system exopolysaccharide export protein [Steroidobacteraceae bacterium]|nr:XrtA/PEP-CTERM system exopolysaccharide export protein [Steroidobacteraceae bacterium]